MQLFIMRLKSTSKNLNKKHLFILQCFTKAFDLFFFVEWLEAMNCELFDKIYHLDSV